LREKHLGLELTSFQDVDDLLRQVGIDTSDDESRRTLSKVVESVHWFLHPQRVTLMLDACHLLASAACVASCLIFFLAGRLADRASPPGCMSGWRSITALTLLSARGAVKDGANKSELLLTDPEQPQLLVTAAKSLCEHNFFGGCVPVNQHENTCI